MRIYKYADCSTLLPFLSHQSSILFHNALSFICQLFSASQASHRSRHIIDVNLGAPSNLEFLLWLGQLRWRLHNIQEICRSIQPFLLVQLSPGVLIVVVTIIVVIRASIIVALPLVLLLFLLRLRRGNLFLRLGLPSLRLPLFP